ncbi:MAG: ribosome silencing factor [Clostridia bacterium]|nr:ribosome silencing factor [Clostridia bacterium]MBQ9919702.1 ribosome silencing factor [Clostridia bacterium]
MQGLDIVKVACKALDDKKAIDLKAIEVTEVTVLADYFVLATATSTTHVRALADEVEDALSKNGLEPHHIEGRTTGWILLDYGSVVINVMDAKNRDFYGLDHTWNDGKELDISDYIKD